MEKQATEVVLSDHKEKIILVVDGIRYEIRKGSSLSSLTIQCPGREIMTRQNDPYILEVW